jgi:hypothetical protein
MIGAERSLAATRVDDVAMRVTSNSAFEEQGVVSSTPLLEAPTDGRLRITRLDAWKQTIRNQEFKRALQIHRTELERAQDTERLIRESMQGWGLRGGLLQGQIVADLMNNGAAATSTAYTGKKFYAPVGDPHPNGEGATFYNDFTASEIGDLNVTTPSAPPPNTFVDCVLQVVQAMKGYQDDSGGPVNTIVSEWLVEVPSGLWAAAFKASRQARFDVGASNVLVDRAGGMASVADESGNVITIRSNELLTRTDTRFYVHALGDFSKPFVLQEEKPIEVDYLDRANAPEFWIKEDSVLIRSYWRGGGGYANPRKSSRATFS